MTAPGRGKTQDPRVESRVMTSTATPFWIIGCGDVGRRILRRLAARGEHPAALVRSEASEAACAVYGGPVVRADLDDVLAADLVGDGRIAVVYLAPPPRSGCTDPRIRRFLARFGDRVARLVLVSTTGVYGDCEGEWIDEDTPAAPQTDRGRRRLDAERAVAEWSSATGGNYIILRVPGIYAEDRLPLERLRRGLPVVHESEAAFTNRIHAEDLARICLAALESNAANVVLNATDGHPTTMTEYFNRVADAVGLPRPPQISLDEAHSALSEGMLSYARESRRIDNRRLLEVLAIELEYPDLDSTLARLHAGRR